LKQWNHLEKRFGELGEINLSNLVNEIALLIQDMNKNFAHIQKLV
jgi:hypothetical protein